MTIRKSIDILSRSLLKLLPEFVVRMFVKSRDGERETQGVQKARFNSLDGLRGIGALVVVHWHLFGTLDETLGAPFGLSSEDARTCGLISENDTWDSRFSIRNLPIVNVIFMGNLWVNVFFILSGFVLSQRPLTLARADKLEHLIKSLSSAILRRPVRLFVPAYVIMFPAMLLFHAGVLTPFPLSISDWDHDGDFWVPQRYSTFWAQFKDGIWSYWHFVDPYNWRSFFGPYDPPLWTIPMEFHGSLLTFFTVLAFCRVRTWLRLTLVSLLAIDGYLRYHWDVSLFLFGMLVSESVLISNDRQMRRQQSSIGDAETQRSSLPHDHMFPRWSQKVLWAGAYLVIAYLTSAPIKCYEFSPAYGWLKYWPVKPLNWPYQPGGFFVPHMIGSVWLVFLVGHSPPESWIRKYLLDTSPIQYLGRVSFGLYLTHSLVLNLFGRRLLTTFWKLIGQETFGKYVLGTTLAYAILLVPLLWLAELFCRAVDEPSIRLARRLAKRAITLENRIILT